MRRYQFYIIATIFILSLILSFQHQANGNPIDDVNTVSSSTTVSTTTSNGDQLSPSTAPYYFRMRPFMMFPFRAPVPNLH
ncbi:unnamed protein product [Adineta steineri]|uniref:Uncharacterized protein n=2 Tax=Adineta steineri TaxID=433720 RepID=A0A814H5X8_9BILA|nr:unnamed protein product [Adineta steineri]CAF4074741.1 unnamed protein product [Adineta steineri]